MVYRNKNSYLRLQGVLSLTMTLTALAGCEGVHGPSLGTQNPNPASIAANLPIAGEHRSLAATTGLTANASATNPGYPASQAVDGNLSTQWGSGWTNNPSLTVDRGTSAALSAVVIKMAPGPTYAVDVSDDNKNWRQVATNWKNSTWQMETKQLPSGTSGRYLRFRFSGNYIQVFEVTLQAGASPSPGMSPTPTPAPTTPTATPTPTLSTAPTVTPTLAPTPAPTASAAPSSSPVPTPTPIIATPAPSSGVVINVNPGNVMRAATSHILGTCRNHVGGLFTNGAAKLAKMQELTPTWGERKYLYRIGHGPTDGRNDYSYMTGFHFEQTWNVQNTYPYDDLRNALNDAMAMGADQMHVVNFGTSDANEAGRYVSYLNHAGDANRSKYPIAQQNARMFELGNEISWTMVRGHDQYASNETAYATRAKQFAQSMRQNSDVPILIGAVAGTNSNWMGNGWSGGATTVKNILTTMGSDCDFLIYHGYPSWPVTVSGNLDTVMAQNEWNRQKLEQEIKPAIKQYANGRDVFIANTEFFSNLYSDVTRSRGMFGAMYLADSLILAMNEDIRTSVEFCFDHGEQADAGFFFNNDPTNVTAIFKLQRLLAQHWGDNIVECSGVGIPTKSVAGASVTVSMPKLSYAAATTGAKTFVLVLNRTNDADVTSDINVGFVPSSVTAYRLAGASGWDSANADITTSSPTLTSLSFPRATVTLLEINR